MFHCSLSFFVICLLIIGSWGVLMVASYVQWPVVEKILQKLKCGDEVQPWPSTDMVKSSLFNTYVSFSP